jgi:RND family efflux transporter MFP subunit
MNMKQLNYIRYWLVTLAMLAGVAVQTAQAEEVLSNLDCLIYPNMTVELSSPVAGVIESITVDRSDTVKKGQVLASLISDVEQEKYKMALAKAKHKGGLESSKVNLELNKKEYARAEALYEDRAIPLAEKEQAEANLQLAKYEYENAVHKTAILKLELNYARANLKQRQITSPIDGVVVDRYMTPGEYVENKPVLKVAQLHPLRIEIISSSDSFGKIKNGMHAFVIPEFGQYDDLVAEVVVVDKVIDAASGTFGVRLLIDNEKYNVPGGLKCKLNFFNQKQELAYQRNHQARGATALQARK